jgi:hypothetical protein
MGISDTTVIKQMWQGARFKGEEKTQSTTLARIQRKKLYNFTKIFSEGPQLFLYLPKLSYKMSALR